MDIRLFRITRSKLAKLCMPSGIFILPFNCFLLLSFYVAHSNAVQLQHAKNPGPRWGHVFLYDPVRDIVLLFGGARDRGVYLQDTWTWDGVNWQAHNVSGPSSRGFSAVAFHQARGTIMLHGGRGQDNQTFSDTWEWNGSSWRKLGSEMGFKADHHQMVYVDHDSLLIAFGGWDGQGVSDETWTWQGTWKSVYIDTPPRRAAFAMAYDADALKVILYGGLWIDGQYADIWEWQSGSWKRRGGPYDNSSLDHHAMFYDAQRKRITIFGGKNYRYVPQNSTRTISGSEVHSLATDGPSPRHSVGLTYDSRRGQAYLYGGKEYQGELQVSLGDLWIWDGEKWRVLE